MSRPSLLRPLLIFSLLLFAPFRIFAQQTTTYVPSSPDNMLTPASPVGVPPHTSSVGTNETVNLSSGSLSVFIPALTLPQRGDWDLTLGFVHNSATWIPQQNVTVSASSYNNGIMIFGDNYSYTENMVPFAMGGLAKNLPYLTATIEYQGDLKAFDSLHDQIGQVPIFCVTNWVFSDWTGSKHSFRINAECNTQTFAGASSVQMPPNGYVVRVTMPPNPDAFKAARAGSVFVEYDVPVGRVKPAGSGWGRIPGANSPEAKLAAKTGKPAPTMPPVKNITVVKSK